MSLIDRMVPPYTIGKRKFNRSDDAIIDYILVSAAFQLQHSENKDNLLPTSPYASFVGKIYETVEQSDNDCKFGITLSEYNNFSFGNKAKTDFKIQVVYEAGPDSRFKKLAPKLSIGRLVYISGFFDLNGNEFPFIEAKEIDLLDDYSNNSNKIEQILLPNTRTSSNIKITDDDEQTKNVNTENEDEVVITSTSASGANDKATKKTKKSNKRKELADLSIQRL
ncbi:hypothetical protein RclHR1_08480006 [Rhizophagus clarus]|uniref:Uncharacterized protein n=1 Tax=Rhizophagus clarus TaxID=94130 RepID=A0A2Z6S7C6_9GLOM|nr:hypothetical protein RclHR1_08480006 [Rhizophagus clarus]